MRTTEFPVVTETDIANTDTVLMNVDGVSSQVTITDLKDKLNLIATLSKYICLLTQIGENALSAAVAENRLGATPTGARTDTGIYTLTATGKFPVGKTFIRQAQQSGFSAVITHTDANTITIETFNSDGQRADSLLSSHLIEIDSYLS